MVIVGSGILTPAHLTQETISKISFADIVYALVPDPLGLSTIKKLNSNLENLADYYFDPSCDRNGNNRLQAYDKMVSVVLSSLRENSRVVCIFYGHPGIFVYPTHKMISLARSEKITAKMLPAISAEDCLYSDLGIDPGTTGTVCYEASQFLFYQHVVNPSAFMILWQIGVIGDEYLNQLEPAVNGLNMLVDKLTKVYDKQHKVFLYEASTLPIMQHRAQQIAIEDLVNAKVSTITTLVIPPATSLQVDHEFCEKWQVDIAQLE